MVLTLGIKRKVTKSRIRFPEEIQFPKNRIMARYNFTRTKLIQLAALRYIWCIRIEKKRIPFSVRRREDFRLTFHTTDGVRLFQDRVRREWFCLFVGAGKITRISQLHTIVEALC